MEIRIYGKLKTWNADKGFGFITPDNGGQEVFVHISDYPRQGGKPVIGEALSFDVGLNPEGKKKAINVQRPRLQATSTVRLEARKSPGNRSTGGLAGLILFGVLLYFGYQTLTPSRHSDIAPLATPVTTPVATQSDTTTTPVASFSCDGRRHCSQMTSCAEATFFLRHCPDTRMDGDNDGIPCEEQWCSGPLGR